MKLFRRASPEAIQDSAQESESPSNSNAQETVRGERSVPSINHARSLQSRASSVLAIGLMCVLGAGFLAWYYSGALTRQARAEESAQKASRARAQGEMPLPPLGRINPPSIQSAPIAEQILGPPPELPEEAVAAWNHADEVVQSSQTYAGAPQKTPAESALDRRLSGAVFARQSDAAPTAPASELTEPALLAGAPAPTESVRGSELSDLLEPSVTPAVVARVLPTRTFLLAKGAFIDCTLETAIDSTLPGMTTCITATDTFSSDGKIVLIERGSKLVGETRGQVQQGAARIFVLWAEARTPTGVVVPLASPGTDELGRAGLPGKVNRHFWDRFGAAILISVINGAVQTAVQSSSDNGGTVIVNPSASQDVMTEVLKSTIAIRPTVTKPQGDRIQVLVARDVDFRSVYELRMANASGSLP